MTEQVAPRAARESDLGRLKDVTNAAYAKYLVRMEPPPAPMLRDLRAAVLAGRVWVLGEPIIAQITLIPTASGLLVEDVAVHPDFQGTGLGRCLMDFAEEEARRLGLERLRLYTNEVMTENVAIYFHLGYCEVSRHCEDGYRRVFMEKELPGQA